MEDYAALGLTLGRHPVALLRDRLAREKNLPAATVNAVPHGRPVRIAGIVVSRQRPGTAKDVTFVTLDDETGTANVVVWRDFAARQHKELIGSRLLATPPGCAPRASAPPARPPQSEPARARLARAAEECVGRRMFPARREFMVDTSWRQGNNT